YMAWKKGKFRPSLAAGVALGLTLDFLLAFALYNYGVHLPRGRAGGWPFLVVFFAALPIPRLLLNRRGYRRFRREWNERGGLPASNLLSSRVESALCLIQRRVLSLSGLVKR